MKRFFLIPLMAFFSCVMAWGTEVVVNNFDALKTQLSASGTADVVKLGQNITYSGTEVLNIERSLTLDGQGFKITGKANCNTKVGGGTKNQATVIAINKAMDKSGLDVTLKNLKLDKKDAVAKSSTRYYGIMVFDGVDKLTIDACEFDNTLNGNAQTLCINGLSTSPLALYIKDSEIKAGSGGYPAYILKPVNATLKNTTFSGYCALYFKMPSSTSYYGTNIGSRGSYVDAENCNFDAPNVHSGYSNDFAVFAFEDDNITLDLKNCGMNAEMLGNAGQVMVSASEWGTRREQNININISGDNSYINGDFVSNGWNFNYGDAPENFTKEVFENGYWRMHNDLTGEYTSNGYDAGLAFTPYTGRVNITITGGTYALNPDIYRFNGHVLSAEDISEFEQRRCTIPDGYEVKTIETQQGATTTTLYRVRKKITTSNSINDNVEGQGAGQNENTEFLISANETVEQASTVANYVEVSNNATLTLPEGKKLEVTNGLDVTDGATLDVAAGSTLVVGEGGVTSENTGSIVIESNENGSASFLLSPEVIVNTTPNLTVKMTVKGKGYKNESAGKTYYWHRFAAPVVMAEAWSKAPDYGTWLYGWDYTAEGGKGAWAELPTSMAMVPFQGYTLSPEHLVASEDEEIVYSFKGQLAGNQNINLQFNARGFNFFGNSYTGYISVLTLVDQLMGNENIDGTVYMWKNNGQGYQPVSLKDLEENPGHYENWEKEIAPMQTFILRQINTGEGVSTLLNYENSIWKNPRYGNVPAPAPKRAAANADPFVRVMITAANGQNSQMSFVENADRSDDFEKGYDALVYMNENTINLYSSLEGQDLANVATNDLEGKTITLQTNDEIAYTMSFPIVEGEEYAIRDNATGKVIAIEEGATYEFAAQPNTTVEGRFEIVPVAKVPTAIENTEVKANAKGIYTLTGQYLGEDFEAVPAGVYVVNGVKIVK